MEMNIPYLLTPTGMLKVLEIACVVPAFAVLRHYNVGLFNEDAFFMGVGILVATMIVTPLLLLCYIMGQKEIRGTILEMAVNIIFGVFLMVFGGMGIHYYTRQSSYLFNQEAGLAMSSLSMIASFAYLADAVLAIMAFSRYETSSSSLI